MQFIYLYLNAVILSYLIIYLYPLFGPKSFFFIKTKSQQKCFKNSKCNKNVFHVVISQLQQKTDVCIIINIIIANLV